MLSYAFIWWLLRNETVISLFESYDWIISIYCLRSNKMSYKQWEGTLSEVHNNRGLLKIIWLTNCMLIYKVYVYLAIQDLLETARVPIYIHIYISVISFKSICAKYGRFAHNESHADGSFSHIFWIWTSFHKIKEKNREKKCSKLISLKCQYHAWPFKQKKKTITIHTGRWITFPCIKENQHDKN